MDRPDDERARPGLAEIIGLPRRGQALTPQRWPSSRAAPIERTRTLARLEAISRDVGLGLVLAPPGYGKTLALRQWAQSSDRPFAWVRLDDADNDPCRLLRDIALAVHRLHPFGEAVRRVLIAPDDLPLEVTLPPVLASLRTLTRPTVLILDDLQHVHDARALDLIATVAANLPRGSQLVAAGRRRPRLPLGRLRSQGRCQEFGPADLAFDERETATLVRRMGVELPGPAVRQLVQRTEGWPVAVYLAALSLTNRPDPVTHLEQISGSSRFIGDYLREEVLARQPPETVRFLTRASALDRLGGPLCDAALGETDSAARLADLETTSLLLIPQDEHGDWYRCPRMLGDLLLGELSNHQPGEDLRIRRRAAVWFAEHGPAPEAVRYALSGRDDLLATRLIFDDGRVLIDGPWRALARGWLRDLDEHRLRRHPPLALTASWVWALSGDGARSRQALRAASAAVAQSPDDDPLLAAEVARTRAALAPYGVEAMLADARQAVRWEPLGTPGYPAGALLCGVAAFLCGEFDEAAGYLEHAARIDSRVPRLVAPVALAEQTLLAVQRGDWATATATADEARRLVGVSGEPDQLPDLIVYAACARVALHHGDLDGARREVADALRLYQRPSPTAFPWLATQSALVLGRVLLGLGDEPAARLKVAEAGRHLAPLLTDGLLREKYRRLVADLDHTRGRSQALEWTGLTKAELRILRLLPTHLSLSEIAEELFISRNTVKSQVAAVYRKLAVTNRTDAVRRGHETGLLDAS